MRIEIINDSYRIIEYNPDTQRFEIYHKGRDSEVSLTPQEVADMLSLFHSEKVKKDNEIKKQYADK